MLLWEDSSQIQEAEEKHNITVNILNEYLEDEESFSQQEKENKEDSNGSFNTLYRVNLTSLEVEVIDLFIENDFYSFSKKTYI